MKRQLRLLAAGFAASALGFSHTAVAQEPATKPAAGAWNFEVTAGAATPQQPTAKKTAPAKPDADKAVVEMKEPPKMDAPAAKVAPTPAVPVPAVTVAPAVKPLEPAAVPQAATPAPAGPAPIPAPATPAPAAATPAAAVPTPLTGQRVVSGDWVIECQPATPKPACLMRQLIGDDRQRRIIEFRAMVAGGQPLLEVWVPVGISIPYGVTVDVSETKKLPLQLVDCIQTGCRAVMPLNAANVAELKAAPTLAVTFQDSKSGKVISISGSPKGFEGGLASVLN